MNKFGLLVASAAMIAASACEPTAYVLNVDMSQASKSGMNLSGKSLAVVYLEDGSGRDSSFNGGLAEGFASEMEKSYFNGDKAVSVYSLPKDPKGVYSSKDTLIHLVMQTDDDVVFLFDTPDFGEAGVTSRRSSHLDSPDSSVIATVSIPYKVRLYAFDSRSGSDSVRVFSGNASTDKHVFASDNEGDKLIIDRAYSGLYSQGESTGKLSAEKFAARWREQSFRLYARDDDEVWMKSLRDAYDFKWRDAMNTWMKEAASGNVKLRSAASFNMAVASLILGDRDLALKWLDQSDKNYPLEGSAELRKKINSR